MNIFNIKILENIETKKVSRKNFLFYSGIVLAGVFMLIKMPFKFIGKEHKEKSYNNLMDIRFESNPESVKRV